MARIGSVTLDANDMFPELKLQMVSGDTLSLPEGTGGGVRGCPVLPRPLVTFLYSAVG